MSAIKLTVRMIRAVRCPQSRRSHNPTAVVPHATETMSMRRMAQTPSAVEAEAEENSWSNLTPATLDFTCRREPHAP